MVTALSADGVRLVDSAGSASVIALSALITDPTLEVVAGASRARPSLRSLDSLPDHVAAQARWWEGHLVEVLTGRHPDLEAGEPSKPEYDPASRSLRQRELSKLDELHRVGYRVGLTTVKRQRRLYERDGVWGLETGTQQVPPQGPRSRRACFRPDEDLEDLARLPFAR